MFGRISSIVLFGEFRRTDLCLCEAFGRFGIMKLNCRSVVLLSWLAIETAGTSKDLTGTFSKNHIIRLLTIAFFSLGFGLLGVFGI